MTIFQAAGAFLTLIAVCAWINYKFIKLPDTIGITVIGLVISIVLTVAGSHNQGLITAAQTLVTKINFSDLLLHGMLSLLLFAGSLHVNIHDLAKEKISIAIMATVGVLISTLIVGLFTYYAAMFLGYNVNIYYCFLFGALISPTDPIAVLGVLQKSGINKSLETKIAGESLFNDGTAVVAFVLIANMLSSGNTSISYTDVALLLLKEIIGAAIIGLIFGYVSVLMLRDINSSPVEILITLSASIGGYAVTEYLHASAPIAVVIIGLIVGNHTVNDRINDRTREHLALFWEFMDDILNIVLFALIGLVIVSIELSYKQIIFGMVCIPLVITARWISLIIPWTLLHPFRNPIPNTVKIMTWGGLRGGISIALALSLNDSEHRDYILGATYAVVLFSLLVQATTLEKLIKRWNKNIDYN